VVGVADGKPTIWRPERRTVSVRYAFRRIGRFGGPFEGLRTPDGLGGIAEGFGFDRRLVRCAAHRHHHVDDVGGIVVGPLRSEVLGGERQF
jgi:hypothetical protein